MRFRLHRGFLLGIALTSLMTFAPTTADAGDPFIRGDVNFDADTNIADAIFLLGFLFTAGGDLLQCEDSADANDDGSVNIADAIAILGYLFTLGTPPLPAPFPNSGFDATPTDPFDCGDEVIPVGPGALVRIAAGTNSSAPTGEYEIRSAAEWSSFWASHAPPGQPPPVVDFTTDIVIAAVRFYLNGNHCVEIVNATPSGVISIRDSHSMLPCAILIVSTTVYDIMLWEDAQVVPGPLIFGAQDINACPIICP